jgi:hypothetical protein
MSLRADLAAVRRALEANDGPCPACDRSPLRIGREDPGGGIRWQTPEPEPCPACGRAPDVTEVVEVVVSTPAEAAAALARCEEDTMP